MKVTILEAVTWALVTGACLAEVGNKVMCVDVDPAKIDLLNSGGVDLRTRPQRNGAAQPRSRPPEVHTDAKTGVDFAQLIAVYRRRHPCPTRMAPPTCSMSWQRLRSRWLST